MMLASVDGGAGDDMFAAADFRTDAADPVQSEADDLAVEADGFQGDHARHHERRQVQDADDRHPAIEPEQEEIGSEHLHQVRL